MLSWLMTIWYLYFSVITFRGLHVFSYVCLLYVCLFHQGESPCVPICLYLEAFVGNWRHLFSTSALTAAKMESSAAMAFVKFVFYVAFIVKSVLQVSLLLEHIAYTSLLSPPRQASMIVVFIFPSRPYVSLRQRIRNLYFPQWLGGTHQEVSQYGVSYIIK